MRGMKREALVLVLGLAWAVMACGGQVPDTGSARLVAVVQSASAASVTQVTVAVSGPGMAPMSGALVKDGSGWSGTLSFIPVGTGREFVAKAFDAAGVLRFEGRASGVTIGAEQTTVMLTLQDLETPPPFDNDAPVIQSVTVSSSAVAPGGRITLTAVAKDPNEGDTLTYAWTAASGTFSAAASATTNWTAPSTEGPVVLTLTVRDAQGAEARLSVTLTVTTPTGQALVQASFNLWPRVTRVTASETAVEVGGTTVATALAADADGDGLSYLWTAGCEGTWTDATQASASFTPGALPPAAEDCNRCPLTVTVRDGRGGVGTGTLRICVGTRDSLRFHPEIVGTSPATATVVASARMTFGVTARDAQDRALTFHWTAGGGTFEPPVSGATSSEVVWLPPACIAPGAQSTVTATVENALGLSTEKTFTVTGLPACAYSGWSAAGTLNSARSYVSAALLPSGQVLAAGGYTVGEGDMAAKPLADLYNPATRAWTPTGPMVAARREHTLTTLPSGKVLAVGGTNKLSSVPLATAELYDPATGTWASTGSMALGRFGHGVVLLPSGEVLVVGGVVGASNGGSPTATAELYNPATGTWRSAGNMSVSRRLHAVALLASGQVLVSGGVSGAALPLGPSELYDPSTGKWTVTGSMVQPRSMHSLTVLASGQVLAAGGQNKTQLVGEAELYDPATQSWSVVGKMVRGRTHAVTALLPSGRVLVTGGSSVFSSTTATATSEVFDPTSGLWTATSSLGRARIEPGAVQLPSGQVLVVGGFAGYSLSAAELYTE
ncbi:MULTISPECIES: Kelch repeat-containing protein [unclassified Corallococcus]|uniref:Kelch repeat-containing protein n=1 Tax=unclassified Corallococcus TaxID=2685029 RepID=UPI001A8F73AA|nr:MULTISPECIES: kelch motif-containing protein [unclassified Corallococcus]MBN9682309.1 kelch-like protein [Corallococcus sp. NCSPR001]WAS86135.1 kelch-like protein [Corallococcus sp. NCRR]